MGKEEQRTREGGGRGREEARGTESGREGERAGGREGGEWKSD